MAQRHVLRWTLIFTILLVGAFFWGVKTRQKSEVKPRQWSATEDHLVLRLGLPDPFFIVMKDGKTYLARRAALSSTVFLVKGSCQQNATVILDATAEILNIKKVVTRDEAEFNYLAREFLLR